MFRVYRNRTENYGADKAIWFKTGSVRFRPPQPVLDGFGVRLISFATISAWVHSLP